MQVVEEVDIFCIGVDIVSGSYRAAKKARERIGGVSRRASDIRVMKRVSASAGRWRTP